MSEWFNVNKLHLNLHKNSYIILATVVKLDNFIADKVFVKYIEDGVTRWLKPHQVMSNVSPVMHTTSVPAPGDVNEHSVLPVLPDVDDTSPVHITGKLYRQLLCRVYQVNCMLRLITGQEAIASAHYWICFMVRFDGVHAFGYNSARSGPIWMKFGTL